MIFNRVKTSVLMLTGLILMGVPAPAKADNGLQSALDQLRASYDAQMASILASNNSQTIKDMDVGVLNSKYAFYVKDTTDYFNKTGAYAPKAVAPSQPLPVAAAAASAHTTTTYNSNPATGTTYYSGPTPTSSSNGTSSGSSSASQSTGGSTASAASSSSSSGSGPLMPHL